VIVTFFPDYGAATKREQQMTLDELAALIRNATAPTKEALPWLKFAKFGEVRTARNRSLRHNANVQAVTGILVDYDGERMALDEAVERLDKAGITAIVYTSPSHTEEGPRWRIGCPFSGELPPCEHGRMVARLNGLLGGVLAPESWTLSQAYYYGRVHGNPAHRVEIVDGTATIDLADELDEIAAGKPSGARRPNGDARGSAEPEAAIGDIEAVLRVIPNDDRPWDGDGGWNYVGMAVWRASGGSEEGRVAFLDWSGKSRKFDADETDFRWRHYADSPPTELGFGTLVFLARQSDSSWVPPSRRARPEALVIKLTGGNRPEAAAAGMAALRGAGVAFYRRDRSIVYIVRIPMKASDGRMILIPGVAPVETPHLVHELGKAAVWMRFDGRRKGCGAWVRVDVPNDIAAAIAALPNDWPFDPITGIITTPTMRPDGTLLTAPGYDPATGFVLFDPPPMPPIPATPAKHDALRALQLLLGLLAEFPFADAASRSVALSLILSLVLRPALAPTVPLHVANAPEGGTGKSYLFDVASVITLGEVCPVIARGLTPEETEKRLVGAALEGRPLILIDNCNGELRSEFLCQAAERPLIKPRPLGTSRMPTIPNGFVCGANGNNIEIAEDLVRRTLQCSLDANMENPYLRAFKRDPVREVLADRGRYVAAALTIARAYIVAGMPDRPSALASFGPWSDKVRGALMWLGQADPVATVAELAIVDPVRERRGEVFAAIAAAFPNLANGFSVKDLVEAASGDAALSAALEGVAKGGKDDSALISNRSLGWWLRRNANRISGGYKLERDDLGREGRWLLKPVEAPGRGF
jgi:Primase C terminal 2 (PriCT-2)